MNATRLRYRESPTRPAPEETDDVLPTFEGNDAGDLFVTLEKDGERPADHRLADLIWEAFHGKIPDGQRVVCVAGNECALDNLVLEAAQVKRSTTATARKRLNPCGVVTEANPHGSDCPACGVEEGRYHDEDCWWHDEGCFRCKSSKEGCVCGHVKGPWICWPRGCARCGDDYTVQFWAPDHLWQRVVATSGDVRVPARLCAACFDHLMKLMGETYRVDLGATDLRESYRNRNKLVHQEES